MKSKGHICTKNNFEYIVRNGQLYRCPISNVIDLDGYRIGRWECSIDHARAYADSIYNFLPKGALK